MAFWKSTPSTESARNRVTLKPRIEAASSRGKRQRSASKEDEAPDYIPLRGGEGGQGSGRSASEQANKTKEVRRPKIEVKRALDEAGKEAVASVSKMARGRGTFQLKREDPEENAEIDFEGSFSKETYSVKSNTLGFLDDGGSDGQTVVRGQPPVACQRRCVPTTKCRTSVHQCLRAAGRSVGPLLSEDEVGRA